VIGLAGRVALVTGGSRGIGRATALLLARAGADVAIGYHRRAVEADAVVAEIGTLGRRALAVGGDLADAGVVDRVFASVTAALGPLDLFVGNAGIWPADEVALRDLDEQRWRHTMTADLDAVFLSTRAALRRMRPGGRVVLVASTAGQRGEAYHADYAAAKGAMIALVKSLAVECAPDITVNCVAPGWVDTEMAAGPLGGATGPGIVATIPLGRVASAEDVAGPIVFLCSDLARHITGEVLNVNGGSVLCG
jgi:3-oxoacyl-[acyl-carrier protein] reductase